MPLGARKVRCAPGVNSGSFYHFFDSKEALLREVLNQYLVALKPMIVDPAFSETQDPMGRIFGTGARWAASAITAASIPRPAQPIHTAFGLTSKTAVPTIGTALPQKLDGTPPDASTFAPVNR